MTNLDIPDFLLRHPRDEKREAAASAAWDSRWAFLRDKQFSGQMEGNQDMFMMTLHCKGQEIPRLGPGDHKVKVMTIGEKFVRIDLGTQVGPVMLKKVTWDAIEKEKIMEVMQNTNGGAAPLPAKEKKMRGRKAAAVEQQATEEQAPPAPAKKVRGAPKAPVPSPAVKKAGVAATNKKPEGRDEFGCLLSSHRASLFKLLVKNAGNPVKYAAACKAVYGEPDVPMISGVIKGCQINAEKVGCSVTIDGKGKEQTLTFSRD